MSSQLSTLSVITHNDIPVITTELLAKLYGTEANNIKVNYSRNLDRFVSGKHYFKIFGDELKSLRVTLSNSQNLQISPKTRQLILWTERGAARHAKMLETDQAWEVFEKLEDCYFNQLKKQAELYRESLQIEVDCYNVNTLVKHFDAILSIFCNQLEPSLRLIDSPIAGKLVDRIHDGHRLTHQLQQSLIKQLPNGATPRIY